MCSLCYFRETKKCTEASKPWSDCTIPPSIEMYKLYIAAITCIVIVCCVWDISIIIISLYINFLVVDPPMHVDIFMIVHISIKLPVFS